MEQVWAPWRMKYILMDKSKGCFLCENLKQDDDAANYILYRGRKNFVIMNVYPYNPGHLMVAPHRHVASLEELTKEELHEHSEIVSRSLKVLRQVFDPQGFNIGVNIGKVAGVGLEGHVHTHIVPRWQGDTNFMPVTADTKVVSEALDETYKKLEGKF
ncbi:AP-4-A phosphorylase [subsurface metagenome]|jgi:ATP adenylyltransferase